jgi:drug/metabolite transporter (DMT)-like permease
MAGSVRAGGRRIDLAGYAMIIVSALSYSALAILAKIAYAHGLSLPSLLSTRFTLAAACLWFWVAILPDLRGAVRTLPRRRVLRLVAWGICGFAGQSVLFFSALRFISASLTEVLLYTCPAFLALIVWGLSGRRPPLPRALAIALALLGTYLCAGPLAGAVDPLGLGLALLSGLWYATFLLGLHRITPGIPGVVSGALVISGSALAFDAFALASGSYVPPANAAAWGAVLGIVLSATLVGFVLFVAGLNRVGPQTAAILSTFEPLGTLLLAAVTLGERLTAAQWGGAALIIGAAFVLASSEVAPEGTPLRDPAELAARAAIRD